MERITSENRTFVSSPCVAEADGEADEVGDGSAAEAGGVPDGDPDGEGEA